MCWTVPARHGLVGCLKQAGSLVLPWCCHDESRDLRLQGIRTAEPQGTLSEPLPGAAATAEGGGAVVDALAGHARCVWTEGRPAEAMGVAGMLTLAESWLDVGGIVALLERDPERCAAVGVGIRRELCTALRIWYGEQRFGDSVEGGNFWREECAGRAASRDGVAESGVCGMP